MKLFKYVLPLVIACGFASGTYAQDVHRHEAFEEQDGSDFNQELNERDWTVLQEFVNTKRTIDVKEKATNLTISGDVRTEWRHLNEKQGNRLLRGGNAVNPSTISPEDPHGLPISRNDFDIEFNLWFDYVCNRAWAVAQLQFDNSAGVSDNGFDCDEDPKGFHGSGECDDLCLKRAYMGYNICCNGATRFDVEIGRRKLYDVFDSQIEFLSRFDGILFKYSSSWECVADWYWNTGGFVVDERVNHFAWVTEVGFLNICDFNVDFKYSFISWVKNGENRCHVRNPLGFRFNVSQFLLAYHLNPEIIRVPTKIYGAFLWNHDAFPKHKVLKRHGFLLFPDRDAFGFFEADIKKRANLGGYIGVTFGEVVKEGDWSLDIQYQIVQARAIPDDDVSGIGRGNVLGTSFTQLGRGNTNYKGMRFEGLYALTDNLSLDVIWEFSRAAQKNIGEVTFTEEPLPNGLNPPGGRHTHTFSGSHHYSKFEIEAIYAF